MTCKLLPQRGRNILAMISIVMFPLLGDLGSAFAAVGTAVAMITDVQGRAMLDGQAEPLSITSTIASGSRLRLDPGTRLTVLHMSSGDEYAFTGPASVAFRADQPEVLSGPAAQKIIRSASEKTVRIDSTRIVQPAIVMRNFQPLRLVSPVGTLLLTDSQPEFRWQSARSDSAFSFEMTDGTGQKIYATEVRAAVLKLPETVPLQAGASYEWEVSVRQADGNRVSRRAVFRTATRELENEVQKFRPSENASLSARVAYAAWLDQAGLKSEAQKYWQAASAERPEDSMLKRLADD